MSHNPSTTKMSSQLYLANAFSINMLPREHRVYEFLLISRFEAAALLYVLRSKVVNIIGHPDTATLVEQILRAEAGGLELPEPQRLTVQLAAADEVLVAQYTGPRLPEGATRLPEGARLEFWLVAHHNSARGAVIEGVIDNYRYGSFLYPLERLRYSVNENVRAVEALEALRLLKIEEECEIMSRDVD
jgi:hypothetical protein